MDADRLLVSLFIFFGIGSCISPRWQRCALYCYMFPPAHRLHVGGVELSAAAAQLRRLYTLYQLPLLQEVRSFHGGESVDCCLLCSIVGSYQHFGGTYRLHFRVQDRGETFLRNVGNNLHDS
jgi:hypothetical protein